MVLPCKVHTFDASQVVRTIRNLEQHAATANLPMSQHRVLFNEYDSLDRNTRPLREVVAYLNAEKVPVCTNALYRRITYRTMTSGHGTLYQMSDKDELCARRATTPTRSSANCSPRARARTKARAPHEGPAPRQSRTALPFPATRFGRNASARGARAPGQASRGHAGL